MNFRVYLINVQIVFFFISKIISQQFVDPCFKKNLITLLCEECSSAYFNPNKVQTSFPSSQCLERIIPTVLVPKKDIFVSNISCNATSPCNGSRSFPMDSIAMALGQAHEFSNGYSSSEVNIYLLGDEHYILRYSLLFGEGYPLLKRVNTSLRITTWLCKEAALPGCFDSELKRAQIILKTDALNIFVSKELKINRINLRANDLYLINYTSPNTTTDCGNQKRICCQVEFMPLTQLKNPCGLISRVIPYSVESTWKTKYGLINMEAIYDASPYVKIPSLFIENCSFSEFYPVRDGLSYIALIVASNPASGIFYFKSANFSNMRFLKGALWLADYEKLYPPLTYLVMMNFKERNYSENRSIIFSNIVLELYDNYSLFRISPNNENSMILLKDYNGAILIENLQIQKTSSNNLTYTFFYLYNCSAVEFFSTQIDRLTNFYLIKSIYSKIAATNITIVDSKSPSLFRLNNTNLSFSYLNMINVSADFSTTYRFLSINGDSFAMANAQINGCNNISFLISICNKVEIRDSLFKNLNITNKTFIKIEQSPLEFINNNIINISELSINNFLETGSTEAETKEHIFLISTIYINNYTMKSNDSNIFLFKRLEKGGTLLANNIIIEASLTGKIIRSDSFSYIKISNSRFFNMWNPYNGPFVFYITDYNLFNAESIYISDFINTDYAVYLSICSNCSISINDITVANQKILFSTPYFFYATENITMSNLKFYNIRAEIVKSQIILLNAKFTQVTDVYFNTPQYSCQTLIQSSSSYSWFSYIEAIGDPNFIIPCKLILINNVYTISIVLEHIKLINMTGYLDESFLDSRNGMLNLNGADSEILRAIIILEYILIENITFLDCGTSYYGLIGVSNVFNIDIKNIQATKKYRNVNLFSKGGILTISYANKATIENVFVDSLMSILAGAGLYLSQIYFVSMKNISLSNLASQDNSGSIYINKVFQLSCSQLTIENSTSLLKGGAITLEGQHQSLFTDVIIKNVGSPDGDGGAIYLDSGSLKIINMTVINARAARGGLIYIWNGNLLEIDGILFTNGKVKQEGLFCSIEDVTFLSLKNLVIANSSSPEAQGGVVIQGFSPNTYEFKAITLFNISMLMANFLLVNSDDTITIDGLKASFIHGNLVKYTSRTYSKCVIKNLEINELFSDENGVFKIELMILEISGNNNIIRASSIFASFLKASSCIISLNNLIFYHNYQPQNSLGFIILDLISTNTTINNLLFNVKQPSANFSSLLKQVYGYTHINNSQIEYCRSRFLSCIQLENSNLELEKTTFLKAEGMISGSIYMLTSKASIRKCVFNQGKTLNKAVRDGFLSKGYTVYSNEIAGINILKEAELKIRFENSEFVINSPAEAPLVSFESYQSIEILNSTFSSRILDSLWGAFLVLRSEILINKCLFRGLSAHTGAAIIFYNDLNNQSLLIDISESEFDSNSADVGGAMLLIGNLKGTLNKNKFHKNSAKKVNTDKMSGIGGCLYFSCLNCSESALTLNNNTFQENYADYHSPTVFSQARIILIEENEFLDNWDGINFTIGISALPLRAQISNFLFRERYYRERFSYENEMTDNIRSLVSGAFFDIKITFTDAFNQSLIFSNFVKTKLSKEVNSTAAIWTENLVSSPGSSIFQGVKVNLQPNSSFDLQIDIDFLEEELLPFIFERNNENNLTRNISTFIRPCTKGELYISGVYSCELCKEGAYSLSDPTKADYYRQKCKICPPNAFCSGGEMITPLRGYWRAHSNSSVIIECISLDSCLGNSDGFDNYTFEEKVQGRCAKHHSGPMCQICDEGFARIIGDGVCLECSDNPALYLKTIIGMICIIAYVIIQINYSLKKSSDNYSNILLKQLLTHFQQISVISFADFGWTSEIKSYFFFQNYLSLFSEEIFSFDCMFQETNQHLLIRNVFIAVVMPIVLTVLLLILSFLFSLVFLRKISIKSLFVHGKISLLLIVFILYPEIVRKCFSLLDCFEIEDYNHTRVLRKGTDVQCWTDYHRFYIVAIALPGFLLWGVFYPLTLMITMYRRKVGVQNKKPVAETENTMLTTENAELIPWKSQTAHPESSLLAFPEKPPSSEKSQIPIIIADNSTKNLLVTNSTSRPSLIKSDKTKARISLMAFIDIEKRMKIMSLTLKFIYKGYKPHYYYWELVIFLKKILIIFIGSFTDLVQPQSRATILIVLINFFLILQIRVEPYKLEILNRLEYWSLIVVFLSAIIGTMLFSESLKFLGIMFMGIMIALNILFFVYWIYIFFSLNLKRKKMNAK